MPNKVNEITSDISNHIIAFQAEAVEIAEIAMSIHNQMQTSENCRSVYSPALLLICNILEDFSTRLGTLSDIVHSDKK